MRTSALFPALLSLVSLVSPIRAAAVDDASQAKLPATFKPAQVFKNANLVHVISLERNYVKESINVLIENIDSKPQDEYYLPFTADQMSRLGGLEVKDRKDANAGPFGVEAVEFDPERCDVLCCSILPCSR